MKTHDEKPDHSPEPGITSLSARQAAREESLWMESQQAFSISRGIINLDAARTCPSLRCVTESMIRYIWQQEELPIQQWEKLCFPRMETVRVSMARQFGCDPEEVALVRNATEALQTVLLGVDLQPGDEVLITNRAYGSMASALENRRQREGIVITEVDLLLPPASTDDLIGAFDQAITPKTRLILISHMLFANGHILPVKQICDLAHQRGVEVVVDGAQSFGHVDFKQSDLDCDYFGASLHKWLLAPRGTGVLYIRKDKIGKVSPRLGGSLRDPARESMHKFEWPGTQSAAPFMAIGDALGFYKIIGPKRKEERLRYLATYWAERLQALPGIRLHTVLTPEMSCGIVSFGMDGVNIYGLGQYLWERHRIQITAYGHRHDMVRVSPNLYTTLDELDYFCEVMEDVAGNGLPEPYKDLEPKRRHRRG